MPKHPGSQFSSLDAQLIETERSTVAAFKSKLDAQFTKHFAGDYVSVANDGIKTAQDEVRGMHALDLESIELEDEIVRFPAENVALLTYKMAVKGKRGDVVVSGDIYASTVYLRRDTSWEVVLHTESMGQ